MLKVLEEELESRWDETYEEGGTMEKMMGIIATLQEYHYLTTYGDYLAILMKQLRAVVPPVLIPEMGKKNVCAISTQARREMRDYGDWIRAGEKEPAPKVPLLQNINVAARELKVSGHEILFMIKTYADRNELADSKVNEYVKNSNFTAVAAPIQRDRANLKNVFPQHRRKHDFDAMSYVLRSRSGSVCVTNCPLIHEESSGIATLLVPFDRGSTP